MTDKVRAVLIAGPTASGKSALALALAEAHGGIVVNADSMQVYRDLAIITARPTPEEEARAPHRLYGHVDGAENYSVGRFLADARAVIAAAWAEGRLPIVTGGTGLYFKALIEGLSEIPVVPETVRAAVREEAEGRETPLLYADLAARDPRTAGKLRPTDRLRILRALEVFAATGQPLAAFHGARKPGPLARVRMACIFLAPEREDLYARIDRRFDAMMAAGALAEVGALGQRRLDPALPVMRAHGVPWLLRHIAGEIALDEAAAHAKADTRHYAKRQFTWFRHQMREFAWVRPEEARARLEGFLGAGE
ncbi:tRNA (adenosine(37)-N6)-dimethylallyltransferase MiaA [Chelatococcus sp. SYSU_G07232]|uniref:tRNA dimethylallyltransferase n=1 Tax=Chelatococcus albus TaxID=3047466 RepID=A0ABT7AHW2_9HYPH|nr:tRNA (adenosine(37)-N6)-dimethylallyltransferase MiaA [Chelatococcus sp. SYSU_G07232]MDJ1158572.1 tRNA (adenosine(37)-N6)-dimethylallyltransferase MiaA [Chelatococcus sp. SYSU_G07232]